MKKKTEMTEITHQLLKIKIKKEDMQGMIGQDKNDEIVNEKKE